jgi:hypothetical protein
MLIKKHFQKILLLISIAAISATNLNPPRPVQNDIISDPIIVDDEIPFIDLNDRAVVEEEMRKINLYKSIEGETVRHLDPKELEEQNKLRGLAEFNEFDNVKIVDPNTDDNGKIRKWLIRSIKQYTSNIVLYPYSFKYTHKLENGTKLEKTYKQGAYISIKPEELDGYDIGLKTDHTLKTKKARALYDADIAILNIVGNYEYLNNINYFDDAIDWCTYFQTYLGKGTCLGDYKTFLNKKSGNTKNTFVTWINETAIRSGALLDNGLPRFGVFIVPDYILGAESMIKSKLSTSGINQIKEYYEKGGIIFVSGKSGYLFENFGLLAKNTYNFNKLLTIDNNDRLISIKGCEETAREYSKDLDFKKQLACLSLNQEKKVCITSTFLPNQLDPELETLVSMDVDEKDLKVKDKSTGQFSDLEKSEKVNITLVSHKSNEKNGQLFVLNFNPMFKGGDRSILLNLFSLALSKELYFTSNVTMSIDSKEMPDIPIPAGEAGFNLEINSILHNLNDEIINNSVLYMFLPDNFNWTEVPKNDKCKRTNNITLIPQKVLKKKTVSSKNDFVYCELGVIDPYVKYNFKITISVLNYKATQEKYNVLLLNPILVFTDSHKLENILVDNIRVNCEAAALLRVAINPDPSSFYPVKGEGQYVDNVVKVENKEQTNAFDVEYVGLIPIISPLTDGDDQRKTQWNLKIYTKYYNDINDFVVPFPKTDSVEDFIYTAFLQGKGAVIVAEWDSPVLPVKETIDKDRVRNAEEAENLKKDVELKGINIGMITINKTSEIIKQINYRNSDRLYKLASQRLMVFIDDSTPEGAITLHESFGKIPDEWKDNYKKDRARREFIFTRSDIYFYNNTNYVNPPKLYDDFLIFSVDKLEQYNPSNSKCIPKRGPDAQSHIIDYGYFDNDINSGHRNTILKPNIYSNELFEYCNLKIINPLDKKKLDEFFGDSTIARPVHYIIPNVEPEIEQPQQIYKFKQINETYGYHEEYNSIKFLYVHTLDFTIINTTCIYGGKITIDLGNYEINNEDDVTIAPDQIAVYKTEYNKNNHKITAYFRRGLMSNEQFGKNLGIKINLENLHESKYNPVVKDVTLSLTIEEMKYDISFPDKYERYYPVSTKDYLFLFKSAWSYPALELKARLDRPFNGYETLEPFSRYGVYIQELEHRTVYGTAETHFQTKPGIVGNGAGFSMISNLGTSSIPFIEYLTVGKGQVIPAGTSTSRTTWKDIWGRIWHQPLRSVFPDVPPIPPPLKNFMMTTTYEVLQDGKQIYEWPSDENAQIHLHIKLLNNYPKYFEITRCQKNQILFVPKTLSEYHDREYAATSKVNIDSSKFNNKKNVYLRQGGFASYGACFDEKGAIVGGKKVEGDFSNQIQKAKLCADLTTVEDIEKCEEELKDITTLHKVDAGSSVTGKKWNYSPTVEKYYPSGYIADDMWDLTHIDYDNNNMDKAYKYHMDNHIPNYDNDIKKPHNTIAIPIYKGLGFSILYDKNNEMDYHGTKKKGWWGDNLQNKDDTLVAGQNTCNTISVDKSSSITNWVEGKDLKSYTSSGDSAVKKIINDRNKNIYVCLYNRKRPDFGPDTNKKYYTGNVNQNNIVPIIVDLEKDDPRLESYNCKGEQYTPENLYQLEDNLLVTPTSKDYLYFAANLRGEAKESFNVLMNLTYFEKVKYEGMVKVNEGGRFVYWNPANGPNSFLVVDDPVSIVNAKRNDIEIFNNLFPGRVATFNAVVYHSYFFRDENKIQKEWPFKEYYSNSYGFGDVSVSVYIGGTRKSKAVLEPGETTYAKIIFYNNCGFDWNMKGDAIKFEYRDTKPINANDLLYRLVHTIQAPLEYRFLKYTIEDEYKEYIQIKPSDHNIDMAPEFFDFENINVVTIRDGFKGEYNFQINVTKTFPARLRGKPIEIKLEVIPSYFDKFPGTNSDPIRNYHKYTVKMPSLYIAVPYADGEFKGKVLYTSAQATDLDLSIVLGLDWKIDGIKYINEDILDKMANATQNKDNLDELNEFWKSLGNNTISFTEKKIDYEYKKVTVDGIKKDYPLFPKTFKDRFDIAQVGILIRSSVAQIPHGISYPIDSVTMKYKQWNGKDKESEGDKPFIDAHGAWIVLSYSRTLLEELPSGEYAEKENQELYHEDDGIMRVDFLIKNIGNEDSYNTTYEIVLEKGLTYLGHYQGLKEVSVKQTKEGTIVKFDLNSGILKGDRFGSYIYLRYYKCIESYAELTPSQIEKLPKELKVAKEASATFDLVLGSQDSKVTEYIRTPLTFAYSAKKGTFIYLDMVVSGKRSNPTIELVPKIKYENKDTKDNCKLEVSKLDYTNSPYKKNLRNLAEVNSERVILKTLGKIESVKDRPVKDINNKDHVVKYTAKLKRSDNSLTLNEINYIQKNIGLSTSEKVLIILSSAFFALTLLFVFLGIRNWRKLEKTDLDKEVRTGKIEQLIEE